MTRLRILVAEDDQIIAGDLETTLTTLGYEVVSVVSTGEEAILKAEETCPDLVLMDIVLEGDIDGIEAAGRIHSSFHIPIIYVTAYSDKCLLKRTHDTEPLGYVLKPFREQDLRCAIEIAHYKHKMEMRLRESEERYRKLVELSLHGICLQVNGCFVLANRAAAEIFGVPSSEDLTGKAIMDFVHPDYRRRVRERIASMQKEGDHVPWIEEKVIRADGTVVDVEVAATALNYEEDTGALVVIRDITERKRAEEQLACATESLRLSHAETSMLLEASKVLLRRRSFSDSAKCIFDLCKKLIGATAGYVALLKDEGLGDEILFVDSGGLPSTVDLSRRMPIRGIRQEVYRTGRTIFENNVAESEWGEFMPEGHMRVDNVIFAPLVVESSVIGLLALANKPSGFNDNDVRLTTAFAEFAAIGFLASRTFESLEESEEKYRLLFSEEKDAIMLADAETNRFIDANEAATALYGFSREEFLRIRVTDTSTEPDETALACRSAAEAGSARIPLRWHKKKDGTAFPVEISTSAFWWKGRKVLCAIARDISERVKAEESLRQSAERMRLLIEASPMGVAVARHYKYLYVNSSFAQMFGYDNPNEIVGMPVESLVALEEKGLVRQRAKDSLSRNQEPSYYEVKCQKKNGDYFEAGVWLANIDYEGAPAVLGFVTDISEAKSLRSQLFQAQKMEAIGTLASGVAHDFNNILQVALGYSELILADEGLPQRYKTDLKKINGSAKHGADLVQRLLTFSRKAEIRTQPLNLNHRINEMRKMLERTIPKMIDIQALLAEDLAAINADPTQVDQILMNLVVNARDAMPEGGKLMVETTNIIFDEEYARTHLEATPGRYVVLMVTDTGTGMDTETLEHIFEPFYTTKAVGEGTGLGLAMVHGIVKQHGGHIICYSEPGQGTTFKIYLPALVSEVDAEQTTIKPMPRGGSETILLVDDEELIRDLGSRILTKAGYKVIKASDGEEALDIYQRRADEISLVVLDLVMPKMGGQKCLQGLLELNPSVKVVIASGYTADGPAKDALSAGAKGFVNKPYGIRQVLRVIRSVLDEEQREIGLPK